MRRSTRTPCLASALACALFAQGALAQQAQPAQPTQPAQQTPPPAGASTPATEAETQARALFETGVGLAEAERWGEAVEYFRRSRALVERPNTVFNLANALLRLGRLVEAARTFEDYLRISDVARDAERRVQANTLLQSTRQAIATLVLQVEPANSDVQIDGAARPGTGPRRELAIDPGTHNVEVTAPEHTRQSVELRVSPGERVERTVRLVRAPGAPSISMLTVRASVPEAQISVDGRAIGTGQAQVESTPGRHQVRVNAPGYPAYERWVELRRGESLSIDATLSRSRVIESPWFWVGVGVLAVGTGALLWYALTPEPPYGGSAGVIIPVGQ